MSASPGRASASARKAGSSVSLPAIAPARSVELVGGEIRLLAAAASGVTPTISASVSSELNACQRENGSLSWRARNARSSCVCSMDSVIGAEKPRLSDSDRPLGDVAEAHDMAALADMDDAVLDRARRRRGRSRCRLPSAPTRPKASGMCISRLRLSDGVGGTDCSISSVNPAASWL